MSGARIRTTHVGSPVVPGTDCGLATFAAGESALDERIAWAKLRSLAEGAALAAERVA